MAASELDTPDTGSAQQPTISGASASPGGVESCLARRLEYLESKLNELVAPPMEPSQLKSAMIRFIRVELDLENITLSDGGIGEHAEVISGCLGDFAAQAKRDLLNLPVEYPRIFRQAFAQVLKSEHRKARPERHLERMQQNRLRTYRWRLSQKLRAAWRNIMANNADKKLEADGELILGTAYMPEIRSLENDVMSYISLSWLSDAADKIQKQALSVAKTHELARTVQ